MSKSDNIKEVCFAAGFDKRDADPSKNYGVSGVRITFYYGNPVDGFVQFVILTDWYPTCMKDETKGMQQRLAGIYPMAADVGYHSPKPFYDDHSQFECHLLEQGHCYYDGSGLHAEEVMKKLRDEGSDAVWRHLEKYWDDTFQEREDDSISQEPDQVDGDEARVEATGDSPVVVSEA